MIFNTPNRTVSFGTLLTSGLVLAGWLGVVIQSQKLESSTVEIYQQAQLEVVRNAASAAQVYITQELEDRGIDAVDAIEQEVLEKFVQPIRVGSVGDAWIYAPDYVVYDASEDFPAEYVGKSMIEIFELQRARGARHYETMSAAVTSGTEGVGWYVWEPDKAAHAAPWWEVLTQDAGIEIAAWTPVKVFSGTDRERLWVIGMSAMLTEMMQENGAYGHIQGSLVTMSVATLFAIALLATLRRQEWALYQQDLQYRAIVEDQTEMINRFRPDGTLTFVNRAMAAAFGRPAADLIGTNVFDLIPATERPRVIDCLAQLSAENPTGTVEHLVFDAEGNQRWQQWTNRLILDSRQTVVGFQSTGRDITQQKAHATEIETLAFTDGLTGLANRRQLYQTGRELLAGWQPGDLPVALLYIDLNEFKIVNDTWGHDAGDALLIEVAQRLTACLRQPDLLARLGGDEFAVLLQPATPAVAQAIADRIVHALERPFHTGRQPIRLGGSVGIALTQTASPSFSQLLTQADIAMYQAKRSSATHVLFTPAMRSAVIARSELERQLHHAIDNQELRLHYQPIIDLTTDRPKGFEALVRWQHPQRGLLKPGEFLPVVAEMGLSHRLDRWVLQQACQQLRHWHVDSFSGHLPTISVNLSSAHLAQPDLANGDLTRYIEDLLASEPIDPRQLILEITEEVMIHQPEAVIEMLHRLRRLGLRISLDDFGTGYSSLNYLQQFPVDLLKIDRSFVTQLCAQEAARPSVNMTVIKTIITLAKDLGLDVVAEGIETADQLAQLQALGCQYGQGDFFSTPLNQAAADALLRQQGSVTQSA